MAVLRRKSSILALLSSAGLLAVGLAHAALVARPASPSLASGWKAVVAQGGKVELAVSALTTIELARLRPGAEDLKPRARTNAE